MLQIIVNVIDFGMDVQQAVDEPRIHHQWLPDRVNMEPALEAIEAAMAERGHTITHGPGPGSGSLDTGEKRATLSRPRFPPPRRSNRLLIAVPIPRAPTEGRCGHAGPDPVALARTQKKSVSGALFFHP